MYIKFTHRFKVIKKHKNVFELYSEKLINDGVVTQEDVQELVAQYEKICEDALEKECVNKIFQDKNLSEKKHC